MCLHNGKLKTVVSLKGDDNEGKEFLVKFRHERNIDEISEYNNKIRISDKTFAYIGEEVNDQWVTIAEAVSKCSIHDMFSRKKGRTIALGRLLKIEGITIIRTE